MTPSSLSLRCDGVMAEIIFDGAGAKNTMTHAFLAEFHSALDQIELATDASAVVLRSAKEDFCSGMDFEEFRRLADDGGDLGHISSSYMLLLRRLATLEKVVVAVVEGPVMAGGVGIVAASDMVIADARASFVLPEVLWGLVPSNVVPFLIRRTGFQTAYLMTLMAHPLTAAEALAHGLVDVLAERTAPELRRMLLRTRRLQPGNIREVKRYFRRMWYATEDDEAYAVEHLRSVLDRSEVQDNVRRFLSENEFPWQRHS